MPREDTIPPAQTATGAPEPALLRRALDLCRRLCRSVRAQQQRHALRETLYGMSEAQLRDIGLSRGEIERIVAQRAFDHLRDAATGGLPLMGAERGRAGRQDRGLSD